MAADRLDSLPTPEGLDTKYLHQNLPKRRLVHYYWLECRSIGPDRICLVSLLCARWSHRFPFVMPRNSETFRDNTRNSDAENRKKSSTLGKVLDNPLFSACRQVPINRNAASKMICETKFQVFFLANKSNFHFVPTSYVHNVYVFVYVHKMYGIVCYFFA